MSIREVRCYKCDKLLGYGSAYDVELEVKATAASSSDKAVSFAVKCPRCKRINNIQIKTA